MVLFLPTRNMGRKSHNVSIVQFISITVSILDDIYLFFLLFL